MRKALLNLTAAVALAALGAGSAQAAFINIDDSDPLTYTITAGDFERGFFVNGTLLTQGIGNSASITLNDGFLGAAILAGEWITLGSGAGSANVLFALTSAPGDTTSGILVDWSAGNTVGSLTGTAGGFSGDVYAFLGGFPQDGRTEFSSAPNLSISFRSEAPTVAVPEPATLGLIGIAFAGIGALRRRKQ